MDNELFPSGPWIGFYNYGPGGERHWMRLNLLFASGSMSGDGADDIGRFLIKGRYDTTSFECYWIKSYIGAHSVHYRGFREVKGIWGTWEIDNLWRGGFHIWPQKAGEDKRKAEQEATAEPVDATATASA